MTHKTKPPGIKMVLNKDRFNGFMDLINNTGKELGGEIEEKSDYLLKKILKYGIPRKDESENDIVDVRFFPSEINDLLLLVSNSINKQTNHNYFELLERFNFEKRGG